MEDYDELRSLTLLFFLDRLMDKGQPRSLHDLSCQFGTKGFTKEMRQIAGGSQSGLRKFLGQYPSLFTIDGDLVSLTCYNNANTANAKDGSTVSGKRDYAYDAVEYFKDKLGIYGVAEVPIKSLLGHRSQASPEVRHISGQHVREFRDFLQKYPEAFVVRDEQVILRKNFEALQSSGQLSALSEVEVETLDPQLMNQLLDFFVSTIQNRGPMTTEHLFGHLSTHFAREVWQKMVKNPQDLSTFLKMHSNVFLVQSNMVSLVNPRTTCTMPTFPTVTTSAASMPVVMPVSPSRSSSIPQTFKQRVMSHVMKAVAENSVMDHRVTYPQVVDVDTYPELNTVRILKAAKIITKIKDSNTIVKQILGTEHAVVSLDGEGINLGPNGPLTLLQVGTWDGQVYLFDLVSNPDLMQDGGLKLLLESLSVTKVVHDCRNDSGALYHQFGVTLQNIFDTQAAHAIIQQQQTGKPVYKVKNISLNTLCKFYGGPVNPKKDQMKKVYRRDQKFWSRRPLTEEMIVYASYDVLALVPTVYEAMKRLILPAFLPLFVELCQEQINTYIKVDEVKMKKKNRKIESEVADLKAKLASITGKQVVLSNREIRLLRHLELTDEEREKLEGSYKVAKKLERLQLKNSEGGSIKSTGDSETSYENGEEMSNDYDELDEDLDSYDDGSGGKTSPESPFHQIRSETVISPSDSGCGIGASTWQFMDDYLSNRGVETMLRNGNVRCHCSCHKILSGKVSASLSSSDVLGFSSSERESIQSYPTTLMDRTSSSKVDASCQTLSTGDIVITKVFFEEQERDDFSPSKEKLVSSGMLASFPEKN